MRIFIESKKKKMWSNFYHFVAAAALVSAAPHSHRPDAYCKFHELTEEI